MHYKKSDFHYELPEHLIARHPLPERSASRMLLAAVQDGGDMQLADYYVHDLPNFLDEKDLLVFNNTRVLSARLFGTKSSGGRVEVLIERVQSDFEATAYVRASKAPKPGSVILVGRHALRIIGREEALFVLQSTIPLAQLLENYGEMPIPPYLQRDADARDDERYQTVYAKHPGAVAAPTAGLHFDVPLLQKIAQKGVATAEVTLHVGAGTFSPVRHEDLREHVMHREWLCVPQETVDAVAACKARGGRVVAVGTTTLRALESAARDGVLKPFQGDSGLFITPGYRFRCVDALFTNFHLPESTLLMLVSAFAGFGNTRRIYAHAIAREYRFYSYGDALFLPANMNES